MKSNVAILVLLFCALAFAQYESIVDSIMDDAIKSQAFPGATVVIGDRFGQIFYKNYGKFTYDAKSTPMSEEVFYILFFSITAFLNTWQTLYDLASVTKVLSTTTAVAMFYQRGELSMSLLFFFTLHNFFNKFSILNTITTS